MILHKMGAHLWKPDLEIMMHDQCRTMNDIRPAKMNTIDLTAVSRKLRNHQGERTLTLLTLVVRSTDHDDIRKNLVGPLCKMAHKRPNQRGVRYHLRHILT